MILVLASPVDRAASEFVRQAGSGAKLLTCRSLSMPGWRLSVPRRAQWCKAARSAGLRVSASDDSRPLWPVPVIGYECVGASSPLVRDAACRLARTAGAPVLRVWFGGEPDQPLFAGADLWPDISEPGIAAALMNLIGADVRA